MGAGDNTERAPGRTSGTYGDQEGGPMRYEKTAPVGSAAGDKDRDKDKDRWGPGYDGADRDRWAPGKDGYDPERGRWSPGRGWVGEGGDRYGPGKDGGKDGWSPTKAREGRDLFSEPGTDLDRFGRGADDKDRYGPGRDGDKDRYGPGRDGDKDRYGPGRDGDKDRYGPGRDGDRDRWGPGTGGDDQDRYGPGREGEDRGRYAPGQDGDRERLGPGYDDKGRYAPGGDKHGWGPGAGGKDGEWSPGRVGEDGRRLAPGEDGYDDDLVRFGPGFARVGSGREDDKDRKDKDKDDKDKKGKKSSKKGRKGSDKDDDKDKSRKGSEKDEDGEGKDKKDKKDKKKDKDEKDKDKEKKGGGLFSKFKKPKDSKSKLPEDETGAHPGHGDQDEGRGAGSHPDAPDVAGKEKKGAGYPGYGPGFVPGLGVGAGDMSMAGVQGEEKWIDNKMRFEPIVPPKKETKDSLTSGEDGIDHTMPFFSPAATSTFGRPGKVPPPVPPKHNSFAGDDSFSRTDIYKTEKDGIQETRVEHKVVLSSTDDDFDYDAALAEAIRSVTEFNPDMSVERIECVQQIEEVKDK